MPFLESKTSKFKKNVQKALKKIFEVFVDFLMNFFFGFFCHLSLDF